MTWTEFKDEVESRGIQDNEEIKYIDVQVVNPKNICISKRSYWSEKEKRTYKTIQIS